MSLLGEILITVENEKGYTKHILEENELRRNSEAFVDLLNNKGEFDEMIIYDVSHECFKSFVCWVYFKKVSVQEMGGAKIDWFRSTQLAPTPAGRKFRAMNPILPVRVTRSNESWWGGLSRNGRIYGRLLDLYIFAIAYRCGPFKKAVMLEAQRFLYSDRILPHPIIVNKAVSTLRGDSPFLQFLSRAYAQNADVYRLPEAMLAQLSPVFLAEVRLVYHKLTVLGSLGDMDDDWCELHEHTDYFDKMVCQCNRPSDPDVVAQMHLLERTWPRPMLSYMNAQKELGF